MNLLKDSGTSGQLKHSASSFYALEILRDKMPFQNEVDAYHMNAICPCEAVL
jgi:hypothetical protein